MTTMFTLFPRRWSHWLLFLVGPMFLATYFGLLSWGPVEEAIKQVLSQQPGLPRAEGLLGLVSLLGLLAARRRSVRGPGLRQERNVAAVVSTGSRPRRQRLSYPSPLDRSAPASEGPT